MKFWLFLALGALVSGLTLSPADLIASGRYDEAERILTQRLMAGQYAGTEEPLKRLAKARPEVARYKYLLGFGLLGRFRFAEAEVALRQAVEAEPTEPAWLHALAKSLLEQGRNRAAAEVLDRAIAFDPDPEYRFAKAMCLLNAGDPDRAEIELRACLRDRPDHAEARYKLGKILADRGDDRESLDLFRQCLQSNPGHLEARFRLGMAESKVGDPSSAVIHFESVLEEIPGHVGALYNLGRVLIRLGRGDEGRRRLQEFKEMSELEDNIQFHREFVRIQPTQVEKRLGLARLLFEAGRLDDALTQLLAARTLAPRRSETYRQLEAVFGRLGRGEDQQRAAAFADELERSSP